VSYAFLSLRSPPRRAFGAAEGLGFTMPASVLDHMDRVNDEISALDKDIQKDLGDPHGVVGQSLLGEWTGFTNAPKEIADDLTVAPPQGWRLFYKDFSGVLDRLWDSDAINQRTGEFEWRFIEMYDKFVKAGGKPSIPRPTPGLTPLSPPKEERDKVATYLKWGLFLGGLAIAGYFLRSVPWDLAHSGRKRARTNARRASCSARDRARLKRLCDRLYDARTPERERRDLSLEVSFLRAKLAKCRDPLGSMQRASGEE
jgi:hypothetical protein